MYSLALPDFESTKCVVDSNISNNSMTMLPSSYPRFRTFLIFHAMAITIMMMAMVEMQTLTTYQLVLKLSKENKLQFICIGREIN